MSRKRDDESTASNTDVAADSPLPEYDRLLGRKQLQVRDEQRALLRVNHSSLNAEFFKESGMLSYPIASQKEMGVVIGPMSMGAIKELLQKSLIKGSDQIMKSFDRWKSARMQFPELYSHFAGSENTNTETASVSGASFDETRTDPMPDPFYSSEENLNEQKEESLGSEMPVDTAPELSQEEMMATLGETLDLESPADEVMGPSLALKEPIFEPTPPPPKATRNPTPIRVAERSVKPLSRGPDVFQQASSRVKSKKSTLTFAGTFSIVVLLGLGLFAWKKSNKIPFAPTSESPPATLAGAQPGPAPRLTLSEDQASWPADLRPKNIEQLYTDKEDVNLNKVRKIVIAYQQNGAQVFSRDDEMFLRRQAGEGSSSPQAQLLAANHLALHYVARGQESDAIRTLKSIVEYNPNDLPTLVNLAVASYAVGNFAESIELTNVAMGYTLATSNPAVSWFANALHGLAVAKNAQPRKEDVDQDFRSVEQKNANNPLFYGLWIKAYQSKNFKTPPKEEIKRLLMKALWADPDKMIDSSYESVPLLRFWFIREAFEGLLEAAQMPEAKLKKGQKEFLELFVKKRSPGIGLQRIISPEVKEQLNRERVEDPLSQLLYGYMLKEEAKYEEAAQALASLHRDPLNRVESSYPSSFAGELALATGNFDDAKLFFQQAIERNRNDVNALYGYVLMSRERGEFGEARAKLEQVIPGDPSFYPALLRMDRFSFQRRMFVRE